jgi:hypothetical protein
MAIYNELSSDIAAAIIAQKKPTQEAQQLKQIILQVHSALQEMSENFESSKTTKPFERSEAGPQPELRPTRANSA